MSAIPLSVAEAKLATWLAAEDGVALGQSFTTDTGRSLTRADLADIRAQIEYWERKIAQIKGIAQGSQRQRRVIVADG